jgi:hypothetical protein
MTDVVSATIEPPRRKRGRPPGSGKPNGHRKLPQITRDTLDHRTRIAREFSSIVEGISNDLGGADRLSTIQRSLIEAFAGVCCVLTDLNARALRGEPYDLLEGATCASTLVRISNKLGVKRQARDITPPGVADYLQHKEREKSAAAAS